MIKINSETNLILPFDVNIPEEIPKNFYAIFTHIKKCLQIRPSKKSSIHNLLKKSKAKFFKTINEIFKLCIVKKIKKLPQSFIISININKNIEYMNKTMIQIYQNFNLLPDYQTLSNNKQIKKGKAKLFKKFCSLNFMQLYQEYIESKRYAYDLEQVSNCDGKRIKILYEYVSKNYIVYFMNYGKPSLKQISHKYEGDKEPKKDENVINEDKEDTNNSASLIS